MRIIIEAIKLNSGHALVCDPAGAGCAYPPRRWGVRLPSGLTHWFDSRADALASQYWPSRARVEYIRHPNNY